MATHLPTDSVAADMDRVFKPLAQRALSATQASPSSARSHQRARGWSRMVLVAPILFVVAGGTLAIGYVSQDALGPKSSTRATLTTMRRVVAGPAAPAHAPTATVPSVQSVVASPIDATLPPQVGSDPDRGAVATATRPANTARFSNQPQDLANARSSPELRTSLARSDPALQPAPAQRDRLIRPAQNDCVAGSLEDRCIYQDVLNADARLRMAYGRARRAGVSTQQLTAINRRWVRARDQADDDPDGTIARYNQLADALDQARGRYE